MPPKSSQPSASKVPKKPAKTHLKVNLLQSDASNASSTPLKRINPLTAFANVPLSQGPSQSSSQVRSSLKGKGKAVEGASQFESRQNRPTNEEEHQLWVDLYEPTTEADLAVHKRKVEDVRRWLDEAFDGGPSGILRKYRRILALTGPAGTAKTTTIRVLAHEMGFEIIEWRNAMGESSTFDGTDYNYASSSSEPSYRPADDHEALFTKFEAFLTRASACQNIFAAAKSKTPTSQPQKTSPARRLILLEDLPNILHTNTQSQFHSALQSLLDSPNPSSVPIVIIVSDVGTRGEASDERMDRGGWRKDNDGVMDIRTVLSKDLLQGPYVTQVRFNPIAPTLLRKALQALLKTHFAKSHTGSAPSKEFLDVVVESANGDIRSAIMALQFACVVAAPVKGARKKPSASGKGAATKVVLESVTRREQSLALFHLMGKVFYNKRKGDPPNPSATAKDIPKEKDLDALLKEPPALPSFHAEHYRRASRVDVDLVYADSPIDSSLFSLYIHQNYTQFCNDVDHCDGVADWLSWIDSSGGDMWYQANPHRFHLLTLGTLHSLPSPVERRSQKVFKPEFFDYLTKEKDAWDGVRDARGWVVEEGTKKEGLGWRAGGWSNADIAMELGGVLKARDAANRRGGSAPNAPPTHRLFSHLAFSYVKTGGMAQQLGEAESDGVEVQDEDEDVMDRGWKLRKEDKDDGGWLESDDIEDF